MVLPLILCLLNITRDEIIANAWEYVNNHWQCADYNSTRWQSYYQVNGCPQHRQCDFTPGETYVGEAYGYGQNDAYQEFNQKLDDSLGAGNHDCHYFNYFDSTGIAPPDWACGIDCSAFVCRCWEVVRTNTSGLYDRYCPVDKSAVEPGDILVKPGSHTVLIGDPGENPPYGNFNLFEASGSKAIVWFNPTGRWSDYEDYAARSLFSSEVSEKTSIEPAKIECSPNPFSRQTTIRVSVPVAIGSIRINIYDVHGLKVGSELVLVKNGFFEYCWEGRDFNSQPVPSGIYFCVLQAIDFKLFRKLVLTR